VSHSVYRSFCCATKPHSQHYVHDVHTGIHIGGKRSDVCPADTAVVVIDTAE
jgi:hypothetical protein